MDYLKKITLISIGLYVVFICLTAFSNIIPENKLSLDIRPFGELCYWSEQTGVLGKPLEKGNLIKLERREGYQPDRN